MVSIQLHHFFSTFFLFSLVLKEATATTLTVDLTSAIPGRRSVIAPEVCTVVFVLPENTEFDNTICSSNTTSSCTYDRSATASQNVTFQNFTVVFDASVEVSCSSYVPHTPLRNLNQTTFTCSPVYACNTSSPEPFGTLQRVRWWKFFSESNLTQFLDSQTKNGFSQHELTQMLDEPFESYVDLVGASASTNTRIDISGDGSEVLNVHGTRGNDPGVEALGYYVPTFVFNNSSENDIIKNGQQFIVYMDARLEDSSSNKEVIFGSKRARNFDEIFCEFLSFPLATVQWTAPDGSNFSTRDVGRLQTDSFNFERTLDGRLQFEDVQYEDRGEYKCRGYTEFSITDSETIRLRIRGPLRPLWPALGIILSFIVTAVFIFGGAMVDKLRGKQGTTDDDGSFQRNYSVVSNIGEDSSHNAESRHVRKIFSKKRVSITQQELLPNAS